MTPGHPARSPPAAAPVAWAAPPAVALRRRGRALHPGAARASTLRPCRTQRRVACGAARGAGGGAAASGGRDAARGRAARAASGRKRGAERAPRRTPFATREAVRRARAARHATHAARCRGQHAPGGRRRRRQQVAEQVVHGHVPSVRRAGRRRLRRPHRRAQARQRVQPRRQLRRRRHQRRSGACRTGARGLGAQCGPRRRRSRSRAALQRAQRALAGRPQAERRQVQLQVHRGSQVRAQLMKASVPKPAARSRHLYRTRRTRKRPALPPPRAAACDNARERAVGCASALAPRHAFREARAFVAAAPLPLPCARAQAPSTRRSRARRVSTRQAGR